MNISTDPWVWAGALLMLAIFSLLWKENPVFGFAEHLFIGMGAGHAIAVGFMSIVTTGLRPMAEGKIHLIIPIALGVLIYTRFIPKMSTVGRVALAVPVGLGAGISLRAIPSAQIIGQIGATLRPLDSFDSACLFLCVIGTISYFLFTTKRNPLTNGLSTIGRWTMMVTFGMTFGQAVFGEASIYLGALHSLLSGWLGIIK